MSSQQINVTELDFNQIKENLKSFFKNNSKSEYADWDFEGSGLSTLIDVLAYNTHYNAMLAHMSINETFLESSQMRKNVVSHAKLLGYVPHSMRAPRAIVTVTVPAQGNPGPLTLPRGSVFTTTVDEQSYSFVTLESYTAFNVGGIFTFDNVLIYQGVVRSATYTVDENIPFQKFVIDDENIDTSTLQVSIRDSIRATTSNTFVKYTLLAGIDNTSRVYFLNENSDGKYEISFGDGVIGVKPSSLSVIDVSYVSTVGGVTNSAAEFSFSGSISGLSVSSVETLQIASSGGDRESTESVRYNAPLALISQNRAVTADDYRAIIIREFGALDSISVWGGDQQPEPEYGKVFVSIKPLNNLFLTETERITVLSILDRFNVLTLTPILLDPDYVNVYLSIQYKYDSNKTTLNIGEISSVIRDRIAEYNDDELQKFDGVFRHSKVLRVIDDSSSAIVNSAVKVFLYKDVVAVGNVSVETNFSTPVYDNNGSFLTSDSFTYNGVDCFLGDYPHDTDENLRYLEIFRTVNGSKVIFVTRAGTIEKTTGRVVLNGFTVPAPINIRLRVVPNSFDVAPRRNQILQIDLNSTLISGEVDSISVGGSYGSTDYVTFSRD